MNLALNQIRNDVAERLKAQTGDPPAFVTMADDRVFRAQHPPVELGDDPVALVYFKTEDGERLGTEPRSFRKTGTVAIEMIVPAADGDAEAAEDTLDRFIGQVQSALLCAPDWLEQFEDTPSMRVERAKDATGVYQALARVEIEVQYVETYLPVAGPPLREFQLTVDNIDPADPSGDPSGTDPDRPPVPPDGGPDGREDVIIEITVEGAPEEQS